MITLKGVPLSLIWVKAVRRNEWELTPINPTRLQAFLKILSAESGCKNSPNLPGNR